MTFRIEGNTVPVISASLSAPSLSSEWEGKDGTPHRLELGRRRRKMSLQLGTLSSDVAAYIQAVFSGRTDSGAFTSSLWMDSGAPMGGSIAAISGLTGTSYALRLTEPQKLPRTLDLEHGWCASGWFSALPSGPWTLKTEADPEIDLSDGRVELASGYWSRVRVVAAMRPSGWAVPELSSWVPSPDVHVSGELLRGDFRAHPAIESVSVTQDLQRDISISFEVIGRL